MGGADSGDAVVLLDGVTKAFRGHLGVGRTVAVRGLTLGVEVGGIFGLLGPNGAGKTTALKMMVGLLRPDRGRVLLFGRPPSDPAARIRLGFLPENPYFYDYLTGEEFLDFYGRLRGLAGRERQRRVREVVGQVGLAGRERTPLRKCSKGMVQRLGLAQALLHEPDLLILDEPMSGLDPLGRRDVRDLILAQRAAGHTVLFSSHILQDAETICDRVAILVGGALRFEGALQDAVSRRVLWYEVAVTGVAPGRLPGSVVSSSGEETLLKVPDAASLGELIRAVQEGGGRIGSVWPRRDSLEELFLREIGPGAGSGGAA